MKITIKVTPRSSKNEVMGQMSDGVLKVKLTAPPVDGAANEALIELLSEYFKKPKSAFIIQKGARKRIKIIKIL
ncbi:MAG TPA: hypothetical protein DEF59_01110 [Candidatus Magasanikbacteria bacterium]|nr:hypothetical protein [Candidatus Magasanikbacteria bacterium]